MAGFFRLLPSLSAPQKAAAVHLGIFPDPSEIRVAAVSPRSIAAPPSVALRSAPPPPRPVASAVAPPVRAAAPAVRPDPRADSGQLAANELDGDLPAPSATRIAGGASPPVAVATGPGAPQASAVEPVAFTLPSEQAAATAPALAPVAEAEAAPAAGDRLSGIDRLLAQADELPVPPAPRPRFEKPAKVAARDTARDKKAAETKKAAEAKKLAEAKKAAEEKAEREALGVAGANWVQLAGGAHEDRMAAEYRKLASKSSALRKRGGHVTQGKDYFRLLTGPFESKSEAQAFVNRLAKDGVDGFSWTRTPATIKIEKLSPK